MRTFRTYINRFLLTVSILMPAVVLYSQNRGHGKSSDKAELYKAKNDVFAYLGDTLIIKKFGAISDSIWNYAELGMQEFKSSAILIKVLEENGFTVEKGVSGMPTCFIATWGSGKPVIGILGEYDALPGLSQKALSPVRDPIIEGAPGHGCGHNMMGTAGVSAAIAVKKSMDTEWHTGNNKIFRITGRRDTYKQALYGQGWCIQGC